MGVFFSIYENPRFGGRRWQLLCLAALSTPMESICRRSSNLKREKIINVKQEIFLFFLDTLVDIMEPKILIF